MGRRTHAGDGRVRIDVPQGTKEQMVRAARGLRVRQTSSEEILWDALRDRRLDGLKFRRQQPFGPFVVDFFCPVLRLVIEVDGAIHERAAQAAADIERQRILESLDLRVLRIPAAFVESDLASALAVIRRHINALPPGAPLSPSGRGAGGEGLRQQPNRQSDPADTFEGEGPGVRVP